MLVTGGTRGIGLAITRAFLAVGARVAICGRRPPEREISVDGSAASFFPMDIRDPDQIEAMIGSIAQQFGRLDVVINNAGGSPTADPVTASPRFSEAIVRLNLLAPLFVAQSAYHLLKSSSEDSSIINIASISAIRPSTTTVAYAAAKAGLLNLTQSLAVAWAPHVRVNAIIPGTIRTEQTPLHYDENGVHEMHELIPMGRLGEPLDVANACLFLASPGASYITGACLAVHGGGEHPPILKGERK